MIFPIFFLRNLSFDGGWINLVVVYLDSSYNSFLVFIIFLLSLALWWVMGREFFFRKMFVGVINLCLPQFLGLYRVIIVKNLTILAIHGNSSPFSWNLTFVTISQI